MVKYLIRMLQSGTMNEPDYLEARIEVFGAETPLTRLAEELRSRILAKPRPGEAITELLIEHAHERETVLKAIKSVFNRFQEARLSKTDPVVYVGNTPRGIWAVLR